MIRLLIAIGLTVSGLQTAAAQTYHVRGAGTASCGTWTAERRNNSEMGAFEESWLLGFLSGVGFVGWNSEDPLNGTDSDGVAAWIDNYCSANPLQGIADAAQAFVGAHPH